MKTKIIPFDLETAKKIQAGEIKGKIKMERGWDVRIICFNRKTISAYPIVALACGEKENNEGVYFYNEFGAYEFKDLAKCDLVLEVPDNEPQLKPFDRVLVRDQDDCNWCADFYSHLGDDGIYICVSCGWNQCIPYEGHEYLLGTTDKPKED